MSIKSTGFVINFTPAFLAKLNQHNLKIDELFLAVCLYNNWLDLIAAYMGNRTREQRQAVLQPLVRKQMLLSLDEDYKKIVFTVEGAKLVLEAVGAMNNSSPIEDIDKLVKDFIELFPDRTKNQAGKVLRSHPDDIKHKMTQFIAKYKYDADTILRATKRYLNSFRGDYSFCPAAMFFIMKDRVSALAAECQTASKEEIEEEIHNPFEEEM